MQKLMTFAAGACLLILAAPASASDHVLTGVAAGGLTTSSQPFQNGVNNPGRTATLVPGQGSPLSGEDHTTPAVESGSLLTHRFTQPNTHANPGAGMLRTPPPVLQGRTAPSAMSPH